jgi:hypothetical protein
VSQPQLLDRVHKDMRLQHFSLKTEKTYTIPGTVYQFSDGRECLFSRNTNTVPGKPPRRRPLAHYELAVVQSRFFEVSWGTAGRILFLIVAAAFLTDTWLATADAVSRIWADIVQIVYPRARRLAQRQWYYVFFALLTVVTCLTMLLDAPGPLILTSAVIGFAGTVIFPAALPAWARPACGAHWLLGCAFLAYLLLAMAYPYATLRG